VPIDYRYHIGSFVAIFVALLLGILIGIGIAPSPDEFEWRVADLKSQFREVEEAKEEDLRLLQEENRSYDMLARETVAAIVTGRLADRRVAVVLNHSFGGDTFPDKLRAVLKQAGATVTSMTVVTRDFVTLPKPIRDKVAERLSLYPPPGVHFRTLIARAVAEHLAQGDPALIRDLHASGLLRSGADSDYTLKPDAVLFVGGMDAPSDAAPERIDLPMIQQLTELGVRVVGCEAQNAGVSCIPIYKAAGAPTVDDADTAAGRLAVVLALAGADGHFGVKDSADSFLPEIPPSAGR